MKRRGGRRGWRGRVALTSHLGLVAILGGMTGGIARAQAAHAGGSWSWVDAYYFDYSAMSAAPTGPAMDRWLDRYAPYVFFEDPTLGQGAVGRDTIRQAYVAAFTGPLGPVRWTILRRVASADWAAVEGWVEGTQNGKPFRTRFSTWLKIKAGRIVHQIDYVDYAAMRRQVAGTEAVPDGTVDAVPAAGGRDSTRALRVADEFYRRYEAMPVLASAAAVERYTDLLTDDFRLEDPTARARTEGRVRYRDALNGLLAKGDYRVFHWEIDRRLTDGEWVAVEGTWRGIFKGQPLAARFTTWLRVRGDRIAHHIDYLDYAPFRGITSSR
ncbi:MAG TPA: nuclear transport factor 2 family protein [Gemmatimonadaceae bacterium]|nr:nuclear transport factor 2 family protein [Gemmatimonadaceae bacterium]